MPLSISSLGKKALALGVSVTMHGVAFLAPRAGGPAVAASQAITPEIEVELAPSIDPPEDTPLQNRNTEATASQVRAAKQTPTAHEPARLTRAEGPPTETLVAMATEEAVPHFTLASSSELSGAGDIARVAAYAPAATRVAQVDDSTPLAEQAVDVPARLVRGVVPTYPPVAQADNVEDDVKLEMIVSREGVVESVRPLGNSGYGLDEAAARAARNFRFAPAIKNGRPVRVRVGWTVEFRLR